MTITAAGLEPRGEARIALESVDVQATLRSLYGDVVVTQVYTNLENESIEAVYTFPLPLDAVLLDLSLELNGRILRGVVQGRTEAEEHYEDAIGDGHSAVLLEQLEPGLFTLNVGNLLPGEKAVVRFRYGQLNHWQEDSLRFHLPTTLAPRYGDPSAAGLAPHQVPEYSLSAERGFTLAVRIEGALAQAEISCPSHPVFVSNREGNRQVTLAGGTALMDRDFVLVLKESEDIILDALVAPDDEMTVVLASFHPMFSEEAPATPRCIQLLVDCSGSMGGDSIAQARVALREIVSLLNPGDYFNLVTFGSTYKLLFSKPKSASAGNLKKAARFIERVDATMGGTEIGKALNAAYQCGKVRGLPADILLITDGEVWNHEPIVQKAGKFGHRIFTVGVGSAVSEAFVREIAQATSGACELVSPGEAMSERIVRHFNRIDQPKAKSVRLEWPADPVRQVPTEIDTVYAGDTLHVFGWLPGHSGHPGGSVRLIITLHDGRTVTQEVSLATDHEVGGELSVSLPRMAAHARLSTLESDESMILAERYQLVTEQTSCVLVFERDADQGQATIPALRKVPQTLAAGWGGMGRTNAYPEYLDIASGVELMSCKRAAPDKGERSHDGYLDIPAFLRRQADSDSNRLVGALNTRYSRFKLATLNISTIAELVVLGLDRDVADALLDLIGKGHSERDIVVVFLWKLCKSKQGKGLSRHVKRVIRKAMKQTVLEPSVIDSVEVILAKGGT